MATVAQTNMRLDDNGNYIVTDKDYPGYTVDALLEQNKIAEAREEFERLVLEGVDSGPAIEVTPQFWQDLKSELKQKPERSE